MTNLSRMTPNPSHLTTEITHSSLPKGSAGVLSINSVADLDRISAILAASKFFQDAKDSAQCAVKVLAGLELGLGAFQSMSGIHIINGKPSIGAGLMASRLKSSGKYDYETIVHSDEECVIAVFESEFKPDVRSLKKKLAAGQISKEQYIQTIKSISIGVSSFAVTDARKAGTKNMDKFPKNMLFARCISNAIRWYAPDVFCTPVYTPEEMGADLVLGEEVPPYGTPMSAPRHMLQPSLTTVADEPRSIVDEVVNVNQGAVASALHMVGEKIKLMEIPKENARSMIMERYGKGKGSDMSLGELNDFLQYLRTLETAVLSDEDTSQ
jgi:hypothetical protein